VGHVSCNGPNDNGGRWRRTGIVEVNYCWFGGYDSCVVVVVVAAAAVAALFVESDDHYLASYRRLQSVKRGEWGPPNSFAPEAES